MWSDLAFAVDTLAGGKKQAEALAEVEEEELEAINIQKRLAEDLSEDDFGLDLLQVTTRVCVCAGAEVAFAPDCKCPSNL